MLQLKMEIVIEGCSLSTLANTASGAASKQTRQQV